MTVPHRASFTIGATAAMLAFAGVAWAQDSQVQRDVIYVPTPQEVVDRMLEMVDVQPGEYVIDLGSGDGRIPISAVKLGARATGIDIDPQRIEESLENAKAAGVEDKVEFILGNIFEYDFSDADVVTMYLLESLNVKLRPTILEMRPGTRVVSHAFSMREWEPDQRDSVNGRNVFMWIVPAHVEGKWTVENGERSFTLQLEQEFQMIEGTAEMNGKTADIEDAALRGDRISFTVELDGEREQFHGRIDGDTIEPAEAPEGAAETTNGAAEGKPATGWKATRAS